jgi:ABC-type Na+ transport system ATPase subunit NatA
MLVLGEPGSGKTALYRMLYAVCARLTESLIA